MSELNKLYDPVIKAHQANPYHFKKVNDPEFTIAANNPVCGDNYKLFIERDGEVISSIHFHGFGCAVSMAAASVLAKNLEGKKIKDAIQLCSTYLNMLQSGVRNEALPNEFYAFLAVQDFPERHDCAALVWTELKKFLKDLK